MKVSVTITMSKYDRIETIKKLNETNADYLHLDVMDGKFVSKILYPIEEVKEFIFYNKKPIDIHLMVEDVKKVIDEFSTINPETITFHYEAVDNVLEVINYIKSYNIKAGLCIKPSTKVEEIIKFLPYLDQVLVMTVEPGLGGQSFIPEMIIKTTHLKHLREKHNYNYLIAVDGGINEETKDYVSDADVLSSGSFVCMSDDFQKQIDKLKTQK